LRECGEAFGWEVSGGRSVSIGGNEIFSVCVIGC
jgi:hypothetical protein